MRIATLLVTLLLVLFAPPELRAQRSSASHKSVVVRQLALGQGCVTACQTKEAYITIPHALGDMLKGGVGARQVHGTPIDGVPTFPRKTTWTGPDENDLAREYDQFVQANLAAYASAMTAWQTQYGMATATHDLIQRVTHRGREKRVIVNVITFDNGVHYHNGARVMPDDAAAAAQILYVHAIPSAVTAGLPASWNWAGGGRLYYELRGPAFAPGAGFTSVSVGATYDEPFDYSGTAYDPDSRLKCLVNKSLGGCGQSQPDVKGLIGSTDATYAVLDYYRRVKPSGVPYGGGFAAQLAARVTDRIVTFACPTENNGTYAQVFRYTMRAENQIDRYLVFPDGRHYFLQTFRDVVSPAEVAVPGTSAITRNGEYPNLATRFLHHVTGAFTTSLAYAPNSVTLDAVVANNLASFCGCAPQPSYTETRDCQELNTFWVGTYTRQFTYNAAQCLWSSSDNTSTCVTDWCTNLAGNQADVPPGMVRSGTTCSCTGGRMWDGAACSCPGGQVWNGSSCACPGGQLWNGTMCQCPAGTTWNGSACVAPPPVSCSLSQDIVTTTPGAPFTLTWGSTNATSATLAKSVNAGGWGSVACYPGTLNGSCQPTPVVEGSHLFRFQATGAGGTDTCDVTHYVQCPAGTTWDGSTCAVPPPVDVCTNLPGYQSSPPPGTFQWGTFCICTAARTWNSATNQCECAAGFQWNGSSCVCTGGRTWNPTTARCECPAGTTWDGASCIVPPPVDVCDNIPGTQTSPPDGTVQSGGSCVCTGGRSWDYGIGACACPIGQVWNGAWCAVPPPVDVCDNIPGTQTSPPPGTFQSGSSCLCTGGRSWDTGSSSCQCPSGFTWNGSSCVPPPQDQCVYMNGVLDPPIQSTVPAGMVQMPGFNCVTATVPLDISGNVTGGGEVTVSGPGFSCTLNTFQSSCPTARVSSNSSIGITFSPNLTWGGPASVFYGIYAFSSNGSCDFSNNAVWGPVSCTYWSGSGGSINFYAPRCTTETGWTTC